MDPTILRSFLTAAKLAGIAVRLWDKTIARPEKRCWFCGKTRDHHIIDRGKLAYNICTVCHLTQPVGLGCMMLVEHAGPTAVELLIETATQTGRESEMPVEFHTRSVDLRQTLTALSAMCSSRFIEQKSIQLAWDAFEYLCLLLAYRDADDAIRLLYLCKTTQDGQEISEIWQEWQSPVLRTGLSRVAPRPTGLPKSRAAKLAYGMLRESDDNALNVAVSQAVTRQAGWLLLLSTLFVGLDRILAKPPVS